jgi:hypothetical protein
LFLQQGYALVLQSERGRNFSEGTYARYLEGAGTDGRDTIEWVTKQPWSAWASMPLCARLTGIEARSEISCR